MSGLKTNCVFIFLKTYKYIFILFHFLKKRLKNLFPTNPNSMDHYKKYPFVKMSSCVGGEHTKDEAPTQTWLKVKRRLKTIPDSTIALRLLKQDGTQCIIDLVQENSQVFTRIASRAYGFLKTDVDRKQFHENISEEPYVQLVRQKIQNMFRLVKGTRMIVRGELFGSRVGKIHTNYSTKLTYQVFQIIIDAQEIPYAVMRDMCADLKVETVPLLEKGVFHDLYHINPPPIEHRGIVGEAEGSILLVFDNKGQIVRFKQRRKGCWFRSNHTVKPKALKIKYKLLVSLEMFQSLLTPGREANVRSHTGISKPTSLEDVTMEYACRFVNDIYTSGDISGSDEWTTKQVKCYRKAAKQYYPLIQTYISSLLDL
jgi:hypothetical protein